MFPCELTSTAHATPPPGQNSAQSSPRKIAPAPVQSGIFNPNSSDSHQFTAIAFEPAAAAATLTLAAAAVVPEMPIKSIPLPTANGKPREPPRKKRGRPRDSKPAFTFRVEKQRVDTRASRHQQSNIKGKNRNGSLTFQTQRLLPQPVLAQPTMPPPEPSAVAQANGRPFAPGSPETLVMTPSRYHTGSPLLPERPDDGTGWPRNFSGPPHPSSGLAMIPPQLPAYGVVTSLPLPPPPPPPHQPDGLRVPTDPFINGSVEQRFYLGSGRWVTGPPPEVEEAVNIAARVPVLAPGAMDLNGPINEQLFRPPYSSGDRTMPFMPQGGNTGY